MSRHGYFKREHVSHLRKEHCFLHASVSGTHTMKVIRKNLRQSVLLANQETKMLSKIVI